MAEGAASGAAGEGGTLSRLLEQLVAGPERDAGRDWAHGLKPGEVLDGRYEVVRELGRGGFGAVYEALDTELQRRVALKTLRPGRTRDDWADEQLQREARAAAQVSHPGVVTLFEARVCDQGSYLVMELLRGETLAERLGRGPLPAAEAVEVGLQAARALAHVHAHGLLHRDLKPGNLFLGEDGRVKLLDMGLAHLLGRASAPAGTPGYVAPEQWRGEAVDGRADVFALGAVLYEAVSGRRAFEVKEERSAALDKEPAPALDGKAPRALARLVARCLAKDPRGRPTAAQAAEELLAAQRRLGRPRAVRRLALLAGAALAVGLGLSLVYLARRGPPSPPSVAVLPFADMSPGKDQEYFADGVAEEILNALAQVEGLRVTGRTSSFSFKGKAEDLRAIGQKLGVATVLEGSVRRSGGRMRINAQLVQAADGFHLWSKTFDRDLSDVFAVQDEIAKAVVEALRARLLHGPGPTRGVVTASREAYDQYLLGRDRLRSGGGLGLAKGALAAFEKAVSLDGGFALAWAGIADSLVVVDDSEEQRRRALDAAERAIALAPELPDGYASRAHIRSWFLFDWEGSRADAERALALSPGSAKALTQYGMALVAMGNLPEAIVALERATQIDPLWASTWTWLGCFLVSAGEHERGRAALRHALEISPHQNLTRYFLVVDLAAENRPDLALAEAGQPGLQGPYRLAGLAIAHHGLGHARESQAALEALAATNANDMAYQIAQIHTWRGERDQAFEWLERARMQADAGIVWIKTDPLLRKIRGDPRFAEMLRKLRLPVD